MDSMICNVVYVDRNASREALLGTQSLQNGALHEVFLILKALINICTSDASCLKKVLELTETSGSDLVPTFVILAVSQNQDDAEAHRRASVAAASRTPSPTSVRHQLHPSSDTAETSGLQLLHLVTSEIHHQNVSNLVIPIAVIENGRSDVAPPAFQRPSEIDPPSLFNTGDVTYIIRCIDAGAIDVLSGPLTAEHMPRLLAHGYRAQKQVVKEQNAFLATKRGRKRSWIGTDEEKPYAYLREAMVSGLLDGICNPQNVANGFENRHIVVDADRKDVVSQAVGSWTFSAHEFSDDELLYGGLLMLEHALTMHEVEFWRMPTENLTSFLVACRTAYNSFVPYHNFRHVIDVLQAVFYFLLQLGAIPPYGERDTTNDSRPPMSPIASLIKPFEALTLLITAIGHDVGHPGVNNGFLVTLNAPLAQLYNDQSVLESFHCAAYSQILRRHWPTAFESVSMRKLLIKSILATDMQLHFDYMTRLGHLEEKLAANGGGLDGWNEKFIEEQRTLACGLLIKCADISNVARKYDVAAQWAVILTDEFARQAAMEKDLGIPTALYAPPIRDSVIKLGESQIGFMNLFALPLFQNVAQIMPAMHFSVDEIWNNEAVWKKKIDQEKRKEASAGGQARLGSEVKLSPRTGSPSSPSLQDAISSTDAAEQTGQSPEHLPYTGNSQNPSPSEITDRSTNQGSSNPGKGKSSGAFLRAVSSPWQRPHSSKNTRARQLQLDVDHDGTKDQPDQEAAETSGYDASGASSTVEGLPSQPSNAASSGPYSVTSSCGNTGNHASRKPRSASTEATSVLSVRSLEKLGGNKIVNNSSLFEVNQSNGGISSALRSSQEQSKAVRRKSSRFRLDFWRRRNKTQGESI